MRDCLRCGDIPVEHIDLLFDLCIQVSRLDSSAKLLILLQSHIFLIIFYPTFLL